MGRMFKKKSASTVGGGAKDQAKPVKAVPTAKAKITTVSGDVTAPAVARMPNETDPQIRAARERALEESRKRSGRLSTILSDMLSGRMGSRGRLGA